MALLHPISGTGRDRERERYQRGGRWCAGLGLVVVHMAVRYAARVFSRDTCECGDVRGRSSRPAGDGRDDVPRDGQRRGRQVAPGVAGRHGRVSGTGGARTEKSRSDMHRHRVYVVCVCEFLLPHRRQLMDRMVVVAIYLYPGLCRGKIRVILQIGKFWLVF